jgi:hypothetical protein
MQARLDGFLLDSFLFDFFERFGEDSSRNGIPKAGHKPHTEANCRAKRACGAASLVKQSRMQTAQSSECFGKRPLHLARNGPSACFRSGRSVILRGSGLTLVKGGSGHCAA